MGRYLVLIMLCGWVVACSQAPSGQLKDSGLVITSHKTLPGGWLKVKVNDEIVQLARFAVRYIPNDRVVRVHSAKAQEIIGTCYLIAFQMKSGKKWQAELYRDVRGNITLLEILKLK